MPKNIIIFSDGTGQDGGGRPEQVLSNVYKMYRICRSGPDSGIAPSEQIAFYDPGLGTDIGATAMTSPVRFAQKLLASVTGRGITTNIADCYEFLINHHQSGDRIFLIGFSRGAYTVRSLADLIRLCGIPTGVQDNPLQKFRRSTRQIADEAVTVVLEHGAGHPRAQYEDEREEQARRFREKYGSHHPSGEAQRSNTAPYFIGVFDTVAALGARGFRRFIIPLGWQQQSQSDSEALERFLRSSLQRLSDPSLASGFRSGFGSELPQLLAAPGFGSNSTRATVKSSEIFQRKERSEPTEQNGRASISIVC